MQRYLTIVGWLTLLLALPGIAEAQSIPTCVSVIAPDKLKAGLKKLVASEVDRHSSHRAAHEDCATQLHVELIELGAARFLTARVSGARVID